MSHIWYESFPPYFDAFMQLVLWFLFIYLFLVQQGLFCLFRFFFFLQIISMFLLEIWVLKSPPMISELHLLPLGKSRKYQEISLCHCGLYEIYSYNCLMILVY